MALIVFGLVDCNNFFASCERVFRPDLRKRPVVVLSNNDGCIIARSNEAKALGLKMGDPLFKVRQLLEREGVAVFSSNYTLYGDMSRRVMSLLSRYTPHQEIYSIDECFLDLSGMGDGEQLRAYGEEIVRAVAKGTGIPVSMGIAPTRTLAKVASWFAKKYPGYHGVALIDTAERREKALRLLDVGDVWGIGRRMRTRLSEAGVVTAWDLTQRRPDWVRRELTVAGLRVWKELRGVPCIELEQLPLQRSLCTSRSFADRGISEKPALEEAVANFAAECARRLRERKACAGQLMVFAYTSRFRTDEPGDVIQQNVPLLVATNDPRELIKAALSGIRAHYKEGTFWYKKAGVVCYDLVTAGAVQSHLFDPVDRTRQRRLLEAIDQINRKNGTDTVRVASQGSLSNFGLRTTFVSRRFTTNLDEVIQVKTDFNTSGDNADPLCN